MVYFKASKTAAFYRATSNTVRSVSLANSTESLSLTRVPSATMPDGNDFKVFLALYQTDREHCLDHEEYKDHIRLTSELWDPVSSCHDVGSFSPADLELKEVKGSESEIEGEQALTLLAQRTKRCLILIESSFTSYHPLQDHRPGSCLLYTSPSPRDGLLSRMPSSA